MPKKPRGFVDIIEEQVRLYETCAEYLRLPQPDPTLRKIALASLHGQGGRRSRIEPPQDARVGRAFAAFMEAMMHRITDEEEPWQVRQLVNVTSKERLEQIRERQLSTDGPHYEVRALVDPHSLNVFSPLIISDCHVFLALDDQKYFRASSALHFGTPKMARWMLRYFDSLWDRAPFRLRDQAGVDETEVDRLVSALNSFELAQETSDARAFIRKVEVPEPYGGTVPSGILHALQYPLYANWSTSLDPVAYELNVNISHGTDVLTGEESLFFAPVNYSRVSHVAETILYGDTATSMYTPGRIQRGGILMNFGTTCLTAPTAHSRHAGGRT